MDSRPLGSNDFGGLGFELQAGCRWGAEAVIAGWLVISRTTVVKAVTSSDPPGYELSPTESLFAVFEARVRDLLEVEPEMAQTVLAELVGWTGSIRWLRQNVRRLSPEHLRVDRALSVHVLLLVRSSWHAVRHGCLQARDPTRLHGLREKRQRFPPG